MTRSHRDVFANIVCHLAHPGGFGTHARGFIDAVRRLVPLAVVDVSAVTPPAISEHFADVLNTPPAPDRPTVWIGPVLPVPPMAGRPVVGWITWETTNVPEPYLAGMARFDILWAPSSFCASLLRDQPGLAAKPIVVVPEGVDASTFCPPAAPGTDDGPFRFFSVGKWEQRKGVDRLIDAFVDSFRDDDGVVLDLQLTPSIHDAALDARLREHLDRRGVASQSLVRLCHPTSIDGLAGAYRRANAFVLATRGEAWGLPILEAMASGLPSVVTRYGGHLDFCNEDNVFFVPPAGLVPVVDDVYFPASKEWGLWADIDVDALARAMIAVRGNYPGARRVGERARRDVEERWTWAHSADRAVQALRDLDGQW